MFVSALNMMHVVVLQGLARPRGISILIIIALAFKTVAIYQGLFNI